MTSPDILGIQAFETGPLLQEWWEWTLVAIISASGLVGVLAFLWYSYRSLRTLLKVRRMHATSSQCLQTSQGDDYDHSLPRSVQERIHLLSNSSSVVRKTHTLPTKPSTFGVYLGLLSNPVTYDEAQTLSQWDVVVLDYCEPGVLEAVSDDSVPMGPHIVARLGLAQIITFATTDSELDMSRAVYVLSWTIQRTLRQPNQKRYFTGVLVSGWRDRISVPLLNGLTKLLIAYGLDVYLEIEAPDFLDGIQKLDVALFAGFIVRNGTIKSNGERRDFFEMDKMKTTTKSFVSQACQRSFVTMMWDTIEDDVELSHAVVRRAHMWCSYHGAIPYFPRQRALSNVDEIVPCHEPLAAFQWLKQRRVMEVHERYRMARTVSLPSLAIRRSLLSLVSLLPVSQVSSTITSLYNTSFLALPIRSLASTQPTLPTTATTMRRAHVPILCTTPRSTRTEQCLHEHLHHQYLLVWNGHWQGRSIAATHCLAHPTGCHMALWDAFRLDWTRQ